jgi:hypothetical protein
MEVDDMKLILNVGTVDRIARVGLAVVLGAAFAAGAVAAPLSYLALAVGAVLLVTGLAGFCPLYAVLRVGTNPVGRR